jgi:hypothetical protein
MRSSLLALAVLLASTTGCSWLLGVSDDPVVVDAPSGGGGVADAGDAEAGD